MLNTEKPSRINNDCENILKNLRDEIKTIRGLFKSQEDFVEQLQQAMIYKPNNVEGSFVNRVLCIYENKFLQTIVEFIHRRNFEIAEYAFVIFNASNVLLRWSCTSCRNDGSL